MSIYYDTAISRHRDQIAEIDEDTRPCINCGEPAVAAPEPGTEICSDICAWEIESDE